MSIYSYVLVGSADVNAVRAHSKGLIDGIIVRVYDGAQMKRLWITHGDKSGHMAMQPCDDGLQVVCCHPLSVSKRFDYNFLGNWSGRTITCVARRRDQFVLLLWEEDSKPTKSELQLAAAAAVIRYAEGGRD